MTTRSNTLRAAVGAAAAVWSLAACENGLLFDPARPDAPRDLEASYYNRGVDLSWRLGPNWNNEAFRVYGKRTSDPEHFLIAEVTSCANAVCVYRDVNVKGGVEYVYYAAAVDPESGAETPTDRSVTVRVPRPVPPPVPEGLETVALDGASYLRWNGAPADEDDFMAYRVYASSQGRFVLAGETDSPGFVDFLAVNGLTTEYFVTSVDDQGHESDASAVAECTPRLDYAGDVIYAHGDVPSSSGFRFQEREDVQAVMAGASDRRHFRLESGEGGLRLVPGPGARVHPESRWTTSLKCGPGADSDCESWELAPESGYSSAAAALDPGHTYMLRVPGDDGEIRFGAIRATITGVDQNGDELVVFDWAYQTQAGNRGLDGSVGTGGW